jgi:tetratricopeptide (TPR) repeat protein
MNRFKNFYFTCFIAVLVLSVSGMVSAQSEEAKELNRKGLNAIGNGHHQEAIQLLKQAMQLEPGWAEPYFNASKLLRLRNKREDMTKALKKAVSLEPANRNYVETYIGVLKEDLSLAEKAGNKSETDRLQQEILTVDPGNLQIGLKIIDQLLKNKQTEKAADMAEQMLEKNSALRTRYDSEEMGQLFLVLARLELQADNLSAARSHADNASKYTLPEPDSAKTLLTEIRSRQSGAVSSLLAQARDLAAGGKSEEALSTLQRAQEILPGNEEVQSEIDQLRSSRDAKKSMVDARDLVKKGSWLEARDILEFIVSVDSGNEEAQKLLKQAADKEETLMKTLGRATRLPRFSQERSGLVEGFLRRGKQFLEAGNQKDASVSFNRGLAIIDLDSGLEKFRPQFLEEMGKIQDTENKSEIWRKAIEARNAYEYEESLKLLLQLPRNYNVQLPSYLAEAYWKTGDEEKAMEMARYQLTIQQDNNRARFVLGSIFLERNEKEMAFQYFNEIYQSDPDYPEVSDKLIAAGTSKWKKVFPVIVLALLLWIAYALYKYLPEYNKNSSLRKAQSYLKKEMYDDCIEELNKIRRLPNLTYFDGALISRILAQAFLKKGIYDRAVGECKHLISINPKDDDAHTWLGYAYLGRRMLSPESLPELLNLYQKDSRNIALVSLLGSHYTHQKKLSEEGVKILEQWLNLDPNNPEVLKPLGRYYLKKSRSDDKAMKVFQKMMEFGSPEAEFLLGVARIHLKLRQFESCLQLCEQVINSDVNNELVHAVLREAYHRQNRLPDLLAIYGNFLQNNPYNVAFQNGLKEAQKLASSASSRTEEPAEEAAVPSGGGDQITCPHCSQPNSSRDYCCQHCGKNLC